MYNPFLSQAAGLITLLMMIISYLFKNKSSFLLCQTIGLAFMFFSYMFENEYFAMVALTVSLSRTVVFYVYEKHDKSASIALSILFSVLIISNSVSYTIHLTTIDNIIKHKTIPRITNNFFTKIPPTLYALLQILQEALYIFVLLHRFHTAY